jgi:malate dehydrogenase (oxaloacetate-decarboxylating)(NADP+)
MAHGNNNGNGGTNHKMSDDEIDRLALAYHERAPAGKIYTGLSKPAATQQDLTLAYSPGVAAPCLEIAKNEDDSFRYTGRGNLVGVISNGTAVLGLGDIGAHAAKPVMEGKAMLFKKFADINVFDVEVNAKDPAAFIAAVKALEPTFGGINLEDIKAPECFEIEEALREQMNIPVMHDDQHGTAIIASAAFLNALTVTQRDIKGTRIVFSGSGAAAIATANLFLALGVDPKNLTMCDSKGVVSTTRKDLNKYKIKFARETNKKTIEEALDGADVFVGVSAANVLKPEMIMKMAKNPVIFALANPDPEILPDVAIAARPDAIVATGRSDYPNQVNNVLGFPYIFRGALDVRARTINTEMKLAAVRAIADLAKEDVPDVVNRAYKTDQTYQFGRDYLIPKPVDPRVLLRVAPAVAQAAMETGVARVKLDMNQYRERLELMGGPAKRLMRSIRKDLAARRQKSGRKIHLAIPHGHDKRIIRAAAQLFDDGEIDITLLGSRKHITRIAAELGIKDFDKKVKIIDPLKDEELAQQYGEKLFELRQRKGVSRAAALQLVRGHDYFAGMMVSCGAVDGQLSGLVESYQRAVKPLIETVGVKAGEALAGIYLIMTREKQFFLADCTINIDPDAEQLVEIAGATAGLAKRYMRDPVRLAMLSFASFGATRHEHVDKVAKATKILQESHPELCVDGEMQADVALNESLRHNEFPFCKLDGDANVLVFPNLDAANIAYKLLINIADVTPVGPILAGLNRPANIMQQSATVEEIVHLAYMTAHQAVSGQS